MPTDGDTKLLNPERKKRILALMKKARFLDEGNAQYKGLDRKYHLEAIDEQHRDKNYLNKQYAIWQKIPAHENSDDANF